MISAVDYISNHSVYRNGNIVLLSICMGAGSTTYAYGMDPGMAAYSNIKALIAVQPLLYSYFVDTFSMPGFLQRAGGDVTTERLGFDLNTRSFLPNAKAISVPTLVVQNSDDPWTNLGMVKEYFNNLSVEKEILWLDIEKNRFAAYDYIGRSPEKLMGWFDRFVTPAY